KRHRNLNRKPTDLLRPLARSHRNPPRSPSLRRRSSPGPVPPKLRGLKRRKRASPRPHPLREGATRQALASPPGGRERSSLPHGRSLSRCRRERRSHQPRSPNPRPGPPQRAALSCRPLQPHPLSWPPPSRRRKMRATRSWLSCSRKLSCGTKRKWHTRTRMEMTQCARVL
ncbi:hypothetical protein Z043_116847, partial [Scleropages formosus]